jgi:hypothetical protein
MLFKNHFSVHSPSNPCLCISVPPQLAYTHIQNGLQVSMQMRQFGYNVTSHPDDTDRGAPWNVSHFNQLTLPIAKQDLITLATVKCSYPTSALVKGKLFNV